MLRLPLESQGASRRMQAHAGACAPRASLRWQGSRPSSPAGMHPIPPQGPECDLSGTAPGYRTGYPPPGLRRRDMRRTGRRGEV